MPELLNIFSKPRRNPIKVKEKPKVIVDYREKNSLVISKLKSLGLNLEIKELKVADYITNGVAIERKTISDFLSSMTNKRLLRQLEDLKQHSTKLLIIEGFEEQDLYNNKESQFSSEGIKETASQHREGRSVRGNRRCPSNGINENAIRGFLLSISLKHNIPIIFSQNYKDTAKFIAVIANKKTETKMSLNVNKKALNKKEQMQFILEGFPSIGPATSKKLLKEFKTLKNIFNASEEELKKRLGKKAEIFKLLKEEY